MRRVKSWALALLCFSIGACAMQHHTRPLWPWAIDASGAYLSPCAGESGKVCNDQDALKAFVQSSAFCRSVQNFYEQGQTLSNETKVGVGIVGTLAGAVFAPLAKGSGTKAWAGLSGASNALQASIDQAFSASIEIKRRAAVLGAYIDGVKNYNEAASYTAKVGAAVSMAVNCALAPAHAELDALNAVSQPTTPPPPSSAKTVASKDEVVLTVSVDAGGNEESFSIVGDNGVEFAPFVTTATAPIVEKHISLKSSGTLTTIIEIAPNGFKVKSIDCSASNGSATMAVGKVSGSAVALDEQATAAGHAITCKFVNQKS